jgi:hypothetical protein
MTDSHTDPARLAELEAALDAYRPARQTMLAVLGLGASNRDPLAEWSERLVNALTGGKLAPSRVQAAYDLTTPEGLTVQVRYLANPSTTWVNEHPRPHPARSRPVRPRSVRGVRRHRRPGVPPGPWPHRRCPAQAPPRPGPHLAVHPQQLVGSSG